MSGEETSGVAVASEYHHDAFAHIHCFFDAFFEAVNIFFFDDEFVDDNFDVVVMVAVEFHASVDFLYYAIDTDIRVAFFADAFEELFVVTFTVTDYRREEIYGLTFVVFKYKVEDLLVGIFNHRLSRNVAICSSSTGIEQT